MNEPWVVRHRLVTVIVVVLLAVIAGVLGSHVSDRLSQGGFSDPGSESSRARTVLDKQFGGGAPNLVAIVGNGGPVDAQAVTAAGQRLTRLARSAPGVESVVSYWDSPARSLRSPDGRLGLILVQLGGSEDAAFRHAAKLVPPLTHAEPAVEVQVAGSAATEAELQRLSDHDLQRAELIAFPITLVLLILVFGSVVAAGLPLLVGLLSVLAAMGVLRILVEFTPVSTYALNITTALGLGLAIDYSLFMVTRFRAELASAEGVPAAVRTTMATAGRIVLFSAATVALSLSALLIFPLYYLRSFAYGGIAVVLLAAAIAVIVLPAVFALLGERVNKWNVLNRLPRRQSRDHGFWYGLAVRVMRRPIGFGTAVVVLLLLLAVPFLDVRFGAADDSVLPRTASSHVATDVLRDRFGGAYVQDAPIVVPGVNAMRAQSVLPGYATRLSTVPGVSRVDTVTGSYAHGIRIAGPNVLSQRFASNTASWLDITPSKVTSASDTALVQRLRDVPAPAPVLVGGVAATLADNQDAIAGLLPWAFGIIAAATFVVLFLFTGSVVLPIKALVLNLLSLTATFGALVWIFQDGHLGWLVGNPVHTGTLEMTTPVLMFCVAFGLSMDYEVFLLSRIAEHHRRGVGTIEAVATGLGQTGRLITSAAVVMAAVLLTFASSGVTLLKMIGLGLALAVLVDATLVRGMLVPAFMRLAGRANWWAPPVLRRLHARFGLAEQEPQERRLIRTAEGARQR